MSNDTSITTITKYKCGWRTCEEGYKRGEWCTGKGKIFCSHMIPVEIEDVDEGLTLADLEPSMQDLREGKESRYFPLNVTNHDCPYFGDIDCFMDCSECQYNTSQPTIIGEDKR